MPREEWFAGALIATSLLAIGCGEHRPSAASSGPSGSDAGSVFGEGDWVAGPVCAAETQFVYVIDSRAELLRFDPPTATFTFIGPIQCVGSPYSMAVDRTAVAWVLFNDGTMAKVDTRTGKCKRTSFDPAQSGFSKNFGMGFATNGDGGTTDETLFISQGALARLDTQTLVVTEVGTDDKLPSHAELTGTGDGRLFGIFPAAPYILAELDKTSALALSQTPQPAIPRTTTGLWTLAFAFWGGDFFMFVGPGKFSDVYRYRPGDGTTVKVTSVNFEIVGAGVSTCAPTTGVR